MSLNRKIFPLLLCLAISSSCFAGGFQLRNNNASGLGDYQAGQAAIADNASTGYDNPAGLVRLDKQEITLGALYYVPSVKFDGVVDSISTNGEKQGAHPSAEPFGYYALPLIPHKLVLGFGAITPYGIKTDWRGGSGSFSAFDYTEIITENLFASAGLALGQHFSIGAGADLQYMTAEFDNTQTGIYSDQNKASDWAKGWHAGMLFQFTPKTRLGFSYHSMIKHNLRGKSILSVNGISTTYSNDLYFSIAIPPSVDASFVQDFTSWTLLASVRYTRWSTLNTLVMQHVAGPFGQVTATVPWDLHNSWSAALGMRLPFAKYWRFSMGIGYEESPVSNEKRDLRLPDTDRYIFATGLHYQALKQLGFDLSWQHVFMRSVYMNHTVSTGIVPVVIAGRIRSSLDIVGAQATYRF